MDIQTEHKLKNLISDMEPILDDKNYVFLSSKEEKDRLLALDPIQMFEEEEGTAFIFDKAVADQHSLDYTYISRRITLNVYSDLDAVGFLAAVTSQIAKAGISVNPVSAFYHDHLFVPAEHADETLTILREMTQ